MDDSTNYASQFIDFVGDLIYIYTVVIGGRLPVAVSAGIEQLFALFVLLWVEHVVAFGTELDADKRGPSLADCVFLLFHKVVVIDILADVIIFVVDQIISVLFEVHLI